MKAYLLVVAVAVLPACGKKNDVAVLEHEAATLAKYYEPKLVSLGDRVQLIFERGSKIPGNLPGIADVGKRLQEARTTLDTLKGLVTPGLDNKSELEKKAEAAAKAGKVEELEKLVHDHETALASGVTVINDNLDTVEGWIAQYDAKTLAMLAPRSEATPEQPSPEPAPPEAVNPAQPAPAPAPPQPAPKQ